MMRIEERVLYNILNDRFRYKEFRAKQLNILKDILSGGVTFAVLPTAAGKSLCYLLPAFLFKGQTLVISPLVSLMNEQQERSVKLGLKSVIWDKKTSREDLQKSRIIFVSPENLFSQRAINDIEILNIDHLVIDESHCIESWGSCFRPYYNLLDGMISILNPFSVSIFSASVDAVMAKNIVKKLKLNEVKYHIGDFVRENISYHVVKTKMPKLFIIKLLKIKKEKTIVYCRSRNRAEELSILLEKNGLNAAPYHAGLGRKLRENMHLRFAKGKIKILCATSAFGMGVNIEDIRTVVHYGMAETINDYYQESGRAGRDGKKALALVLINKTDKIKKLETIEKIIVMEQAKLPCKSLIEEELLDIIDGMNKGNHITNSIYSFLLYHRIYYRIIKDRKVVLIPSVKFAERIKKAVKNQRNNNQREKVYVDNFINTIDCRTKVMLQRYIREGVECSNCDNCGSIYSELIDKIIEQVNGFKKILEKINNYNLKQRHQIFKKADIKYKDKILIDSCIKELNEAG